MLPSDPTGAPPPPPPLAATLRQERFVKPGQLTLGWRVVLGLAWAGVFLGFSVAWKASRDIGLSTWWLGPLGEPRPVFVMLVPFIGPSALIIGALAGIRHLPWAGLAAAAATAAVGFGDLGRVDNLAFVELALAGAGAAVSLAALAGRYR